MRQSAVAAAMRRPGALAMLFVGVALAAPHAFAADDPRVERVTQAQQAQYTTELAAYDAAIAADPQNAELAIARCRFIEYFAYADEFLIESAEDDAERCHAQLRESSVQAVPAVQLHLLEQLYGKVAVDRALKLLDDSENWSHGERARLHAKLSMSYGDDQVAPALSHAMEALRLDALVDVRVHAAELLRRQQRDAEALKVLRAAPAGAWDGRYPGPAARLLLELGAPNDAAALLRRHPDGDDDPYLLARALSASGQIAAARAVYDKALAGKTDVWLRQQLVDRFKFELEHGTMRQATAAYVALRNSGLGADPLGRYRLALMFEHPAVIWVPRDFIGIGFALLAIAGVLALPLLVIAPVHYRTLALRLQGRFPTPSFWTLRDGWAGLAAVSLVGVVALYFASYEDLLKALDMGDTRAGQIMPSEGLAHAVLAQTLVLIAVALWLSRKGWGKGWLRGARSWGWTLGVPVGLWLLLALASGMLRAVWALTTQASATGVLDAMIQSSMMTWGLPATLLLIAAATPFIEEVIFRGALLQSLARYLHFGWANVVQATAFTLVHEPGAHLGHIFLIGLAAGWLAKRSQGLLAPMLLHGVNNAVAVSFAA